MSKDKHNSNLRLLGSPVSLTYRGKKLDDKRKNIKIRPRSALLNNTHNFCADSVDKYKRPFSAGDKDHQPSTRCFLHTFNVELKKLQYNSTDKPNNIKIGPPTTALLFSTKPSTHNRRYNSNASDFGSEDTYMSLGTKIKARAQSPKGKSLKDKKFIKYRNPIKVSKRRMENNSNQYYDEGSSHNIFGVDVKFIDRETRNNTNKGMLKEICSSPFSRQSLLSYYLPHDSKVVNDPLAGRVSFGADAKPDVVNSVYLYTDRMALTKQLSLVEEESNQDVESPSQNVSSLSTEASTENALNDDAFFTNQGKHNKNSVPEINRKDSKISYDDFHSQLGYGSKTVIASAASKDSGFTDSDTNKSSSTKYSNVRTAIETPEAANYKKSASMSNVDFNNYSPGQSSESQEILNHSRLLYKDFFLRKEGHIALPPNNSPISQDQLNIPGSNETSKDGEDEPTRHDMEYPSYLLNSSTKAYTSKIIEDYKKEIAAINSLHSLTIKDIKTETVSPTPLDLDKLFESAIEAKPSPEKASGGKMSPEKGFGGNISAEKSFGDNISPEKAFGGNISQEKASGDQNAGDANTKKFAAQSDAADNNISNVSTQELIQNYFKVKEGEYSKNIKKTDKNKLSTNSTYIPKSVCKTGLKNLPKTAENSKTHSSKNIFTIKPPLSARIDSVQNDRDVESWMSLAEASPINPSETEINTNYNTQEPDNYNTQSNHVDSKENTPRESPKTVNNTEIRSSPNLHLAEVDKSQESRSSQEARTNQEPTRMRELDSNATVFDIYTMLKDIEGLGDTTVDVEVKNVNETKEEIRCPTPKDNFMEIFQFLDKVEQSANDALSVVTSSVPATIPKLEYLLRLPQTELAQRLVTSSLQLEERSCCIALLQESLANHKEQMINKISGLEKQSVRTVTRVKQECEEAIKRHQNFIDQLINDKKTLNHRIEQLVEERRGLEERWRRSAQALEERYKLEMKNQHDKMVAAQQVARQRWVRQKAEKIKELTVKGLEGELREMAERQQKEIADVKMFHAEQCGKMQAKHAQELEDLRRSLENEREMALVKERQLASARLEKQILELETTYQEQRTRLMSEMRAESERAASELAQRERAHTHDIEKYKIEQEKLIEEKRAQLEMDITKQKLMLEEQLNEKRKEMEREFEQYKRQYEAEQNMVLNRKIKEMAAQHKLERNEEIERAIERLEAEAQAGKKEMQETLRRNKEQYEAELNELGETERATLRRYQEAQARVRSTEDKCAELEMAVGQFETRNKILTERVSQLEKQIECIRQSCEESSRAKLDEAKRALDEAKRTHEEQMHQLYAKVKVAVARKDSAIQALTRESAKHQEKVTLLEQKLQQQRKDFLKHK